MLSIPGQAARLCDGPSRREFLRVGGAGLLGLSLPEFLRLEARAGEAGAKDVPSGRPLKGPTGFGGAKNVILLFLQGGPSHIDLWDPKPDAPDNIRGEFKPIATATPGLFVGEHMPRLARVTDRLTMIRSVSYTPVGLFNHTAAMYQMLTGYTPDKVSPSGQLDPPSPADYPNVGSNVVKLRPPAEAMLPFVMLPRPLQESNVIGKAGNAGFLGKKYDPYYMYQEENLAKGKLNLDDLTLRREVSEVRLKRRGSLLGTINAGMPELERATKGYALDSYQGKAFDLILSGRARRAFDLDAEDPRLRDRYGRHSFGQGALLARRLIEAGTRFVQLNWPSVANGDPNSTAWDTHAANFKPLKNLHCPKLDAALSSLIEDLDGRGLLAETLVVAIGEFGRSPRMGVSTSGNGNAPDGRDHWPYCYTAVVAGAGIRRGGVFGKSDEHASSPIEDPVHPTEILATIYHALGIDPSTLIMNHLNQPRELVKAQPVLGLFG
ncbi:MAG TPA: DUF1501 domain-containing protein [Isosphaeraceae bacterium]|nr:DUF1501 domain-containing protein [Isosphaeraceae bacterium]